MGIEIFFFRKLTTTNVVQVFWYCKFSGIALGVSVVKMCHSGDKNKALMA